MRFNQKSKYFSCAVQHKRSQRRRRRRRRQDDSGHLSSIGLDNVGWSFIPPPSSLLFLFLFVVIYQSNWSYWGLVPLWSPSVWSLNWSAGTRGPKNHRVSSTWSTIASWMSSSGCILSPDLIHPNNLYTNQLFVHACSCTQTIVHRSIWNYNQIEPITEFQLTRIRYVYTVNLITELCQLPNFN